MSTAFRLFLTVCSVTQVVTASTLICTIITIVWVRTTAKTVRIIRGINLSIIPMNTIRGGALNFCLKSEKRTKAIVNISVAKTEFCVNGSNAA